MRERVGFRGCLIGLWGLSGGCMYFDYALRGLCIIGSDDWSITIAGKEPVPKLNDM